MGVEQLPRFNAITNFVVKTLLHSVRNFIFDRPEAESKTDEILYVNGNFTTVAMVSNITSAF